MRPDFGVMARMATGRFKLRTQRGTSEMPSSLSTSVNTVAMKNTDAMKERFKTMIPMGRIGKPEEIASAAVFLASEERAATSVESIYRSMVALWPYERFFYRHPQ